MKLIPIAWDVDELFGVQVVKIKGATKDAPYAIMTSLMGFTRSIRGKWSNTPAVGNQSEEWKKDHRYDWEKVLELLEEIKRES